MRTLTGASAIWLDIQDRGDARLARLAMTPSNAREEPADGLTMDICPADDLRVRA